MLVQVRDFVDVAVRTRELGCRVPVRIALLPGNFSAAADAGEFCYHAATPHVRSAWRSVGLEDEGPEARDTTRIRSSSANPELCPRPAPPVSAGDMGSDASRTQVPLAVFFGAGMVAGPASCLTVALSMISAVLALHPRCASPREVLLDAVVERPGGGCACIEYRGDAFGIVPLVREVRGIWTGE